MGMAMSAVRREIIRACKAVQQADFILQEQLEVIATDVFLRVKQSNDGCGDTTLISGIRRELLDHVRGLGIRVLPMRNPVSERIDGPVGPLGANPSSGYDSQDSSHC